ncbi:MAG: phage tail protein [Solirubrobacterales bacterium]|nr:phage tail protein [Solirubrobacterales bacterium]
MDKLGENHFVLEITGLAIGAFREVTGLQMERDILEYTEGGHNDFVHKLPGRVKYPNLVLKRGVTNQDELMKWFWQTQELPQRKDVTVKLVDPATTVMRTWAFKQAYPVKWVGPNLNAGSDTAATEQLELVHSGLVVT